MAILGDSELREALDGRRNWRRSGDSLVRERALRDFAEALAYVERIGEVVEDYGRHPDIAIIGGNRVRVTVTNANGAGFTEAELRMVAKVDAMADAPVPARRPIAAAVAPAEPPAQPLAQPPGALVQAEDPPDPAPSPGAEANAERGRGRRGVVVAAVAGGTAACAATVLAIRRR
jgi:4a-hydroxytetrahydrobiopterin dehydratase